MGFAEQMRAFEDKARAAMNKSVSNKAEELFTSVVVLTPSQVAPNKGKYSQGHLSNQWYPGVSSFDNTTTAATNPNGADSLSRIKAMLAQNIFLGKDNFITLSNNCDYAYRAEHLGWPLGEGTNGWEWSGRVVAYKMVSTAINNFKGAYS